MTIIYRETDPVSARWVGLGADLSAFQIDANFFESISRIATLEANSSVTVSIASITQDTPGTFTFHMTDSTLQGPFTIPIATFTDREGWLPFTSYNVNDTFNINGTLYLVIFPNTSAATFSAGANDGLGHDFYKAMISMPGLALPTGGATGQVLQKSTGADFAVTWGNKTPAGGSARQYLIKINGTQDNAEWDTPTASDIAFVASTGSTLTATNVSAAIEEAALAGGGGATTLEALTDVRFPTAGPANGDLFSFDGAHWVNVTQSTLSLSFTQLTDLPSIVQLRNTTVTAFGGANGTISVNPDLGNVFTITPTGAVTFNAANTRLGARISIIINTGGTSSFTMTFGANFLSQGTLATGAVNAKNFVVEFVSDGISFYETSRTTAM